MKPQLSVLIVGLILLFLLGSIPTLSHGAQDPWESLEGFTPLPKSLTRIAEHYVAVIFVNRDERLVAAVFFNASCLPTSCEIHHRAGFAVANEAGSNARFYVEPDEEELKALIGAISVKHGEQFQGTGAYLTGEV